MGKGGFCSIFQNQFSDLNCKCAESVLSESLCVSIPYTSHVLFLPPRKTLFQTDFKNLPYNIPNVDRHIRDFQMGEELLELWHESQHIVPQHYICIFNLSLCMLFPLLECSSISFAWHETILIFFYFF